MMIRLAAGLSTDLMMPWRGHIALVASMMMPAITIICTFVATEASLILSRVGISVIEVQLLVIALIAI